MYKILFVALVALFISCNQQTNTIQIEVRVKALEQKVDSLQQEIKLMTKTDSILAQEVFRPESGSLLEEIGKK